MKVIIAGSRSIKNYPTLKKFVDYVLENTSWDMDLIVSGGAEGVDSMGERYGKENAIPVNIIPADWDEYGKMAGPQRNATMAEYADALIALWDGESPGTKDMISKAHTAGLPIMVYNADTEEVKYHSNDQ